MALEIKLTDSQIRPSLEFLDFLSRFCAGEEFRGNWHDQLSERLRSGNITKLNDRVKSMAGEPVTDPRMQQALTKSYELTVAILLGDVAKLKPFQDGCKFIFVVGCPRSGGSYLTKQIFWPWEKIQIRFLACWHTMVTPRYGRYIWKMDTTPILIWSDM